MAVDHTDLGAIKVTLAHHDSAIDGLGKKLTSVEHDVKRVDSNLTSGFAELSSKLDTIESSKGPGFGKITAVTAGVVTIVGGICFALIWFISATTAQDSDKIAKLDADREREFRHLRTDRDQRIEARLKAIETQLGWVPQAITQGP